MAEKILITGGAGFIGINSAEYYLKNKNKVIIYDNLSRKGTKENLSWLKGKKKGFIFVKGDVRDNKKLENIFKKYKPGRALHLSAQTTMVDSIKNPREDFEINALGTLNVLEAIRKKSPKTSLIYSSTNKVYGSLNQIPVIEKKKRYDYKNIKAISEKEPLDPHGPYGCSKYAGDSYTIDYSQIYGLNTVVFRQSGIYGPHQFGIEEQGWIAWFSQAALFNKNITIYGNGKQVRDILYIDDLIKAFNLAFINIKKCAGNAYNIGGGKNFSVSIWELFEILEKISGRKIKYQFGKWRPGDQKIYISDIGKAKKDFNWSPKVSPVKGVKKLYDWVEKNKSLFRKVGVIK